MTTLSFLRERGWAVAVHNDYRLAGKPHTFWLFTKGDFAAKGEGETDDEAIRHAYAEAIRIDVGVASLRTQAMAALQRAAEALDRDRTGLSTALAAIRIVVEGRTWLLEGRGPYEWDDDRYKEEAGAAMREVVQIATRALEASGTLATAEVRAAVQAIAKLTGMLP